MSTILPSVAPLQLIQSQSAVQLLTALAGSVPDGLAALPPGSQFEATLQPQQAANLLELTTADGTLTLRSRGDLALPAGAKLVVQLVQTEGNPLFRLVSVNDRPLLPGGLPGAPGTGPAIGQTATAKTPAQPGMTVAAPGAIVTPNAAASLGLTAVVLRSAVASGTVNSAQVGLPPGVTADLAPGTRLTVRIAAMTTPGAGTQEPSASPVPIDVGLPDPTPIPGGRPGPAAATPIPGAAKMMMGTVTSHAPGGQAVLQTPAGTLSLPAAAELPVGSNVQLEVIGLPLSPETPLPPTAQDGLSSTGWPALSDTLQTLAQGDGHQIAEQLQRMLPQIGPRLAANLSVFASALRTGDTKQLIGDAVVKGLEKAGRRDLVQRLKGNLQALSEDAARPAGSGGEWRCFTMPMITGAEIEPIRLLVRRPPGEETAEDGGGKGGGRRGDEHRFLLEVRLSNLGRIQFDGLVQRDSKRFDLIIRTDQAFPDTMRRDILGLFASTGEVIGTKGSVSFQSGGRFLDLPPLPAESTRLMV